MTNDGMRATRTFLASFLVLFLEIALIRWMPAYVRLLSYFSNFILLASFLGIGIGCLLAPARARLFTWFPLVQAAVIAAVYFFRLEVAVPTAGSIYFSSGTARKGRPGREHDAPAAAVRDRRGALRDAGAAHGARDGAAAAAPGLHDQPAGSLAGVVDARRDFVARAAAGGVVRRWRSRPRCRSCSRPMSRPTGDAEPSTGAGRASTVVVAQPRAAGGLARPRPRHGARRHLVAVLQDHRQPGRARHGRRGEQHLSPVDGAGRAEGILLPVAVQRLRRHVRGRADPRRRLGHRRRRGAAPRRQARRCGRDRSGDHPPRPRAPSGPSVLRSARHRHQRRRAAFPADDDEEVRPGRVRADRFADDAVELLGRAARELHVHRGVVPRRARPAEAATACSSSTTTSASAGWSIGSPTPRRRRSAANRASTSTRRARISAC